MMSQLTLAAVVTGGAALAPPLAVGHGAPDSIPDAVVAGVAVVVAVAAVVGVAVPEAAVVGDAVLPPPWWWPRPAGLAGITYAAGEAQLAFAASAALLRPEWSTTATTAATATISATGMPTGPARRASGPLDRRPADRRLLGM
jgi:hypothetical protein